MNKLQKKDWNEFVAKTKGRKPRKLLVSAIQHCFNREHALDLGAGALNDSQYLLSVGFEHVDAVDKDSFAQEIAAELPFDRFHYVISDFIDFDFPKEEYDLVTAQYSLPFYGPDNFEFFFSQVVDSLKNNGIFVGQFFGINDEWNVQGSKLVFHSKKEVQNLLQNMDVLLLREREYEGSTVSSDRKFWHVIEVIARKK